MRIFPIYIADIAEATESRAAFDRIVEKVLENPQRFRMKEQYADRIVFELRGEGYVDAFRPIVEIVHDAGRVTARFSLLPRMVIFTTVLLVFVAMMGMIGLSVCFINGMANIGILIPILMVLFLYGLCRSGLKRDARRVLDIFLEEYRVKLRKDKRL